MLIDTACSVAFYCQRCGRIHLQDIPLFSGHVGVPLVCGSCGHTMGEAALRPHRGLALDIRCGICGSSNRQQFSWNQLRHLSFEKLYCAEDHFELGYIGRWQNIAEFLDFNAAEYDALHPSEGEDFPERQQTMLEALNRVHDMADSGELACSCGSTQITASVIGEGILRQRLRSSSPHLCGSEVSAPRYGCCIHLEIAAISA